MPRCESDEVENAYIHFSKVYYRTREPNCSTSASYEWAKMKNPQKIPWYKIQHEKILMNIIKKDKKLLNKSNYELIVSTFNSPFVIEKESLMAGVAMEKLANKKLVSNGNVPQTDDGDEDYLKLLKEFINLDECSD